MTEVKMVGWHHRFNGHEFEQALEMVKDMEVWCAAVHGVAKNQIQEAWSQVEPRVPGTLTGLLSKEQLGVGGACFSGLQLTGRNWVLSI